MHGFGLYTDEVLSAVCITTEIPDSLNKEGRLEKLYVCEEKRHYGVASPPTARTQCDFLSDSALKRRRENPLYTK